jgi:hypothetical protein
MYPGVTIGANWEQPAFVCEERAGCSAADMMDLLGPVEAIDPALAVRVFPQEKRFQDVISA